MPENDKSKFDKPNRIDTPVASEATGGGADGAPDSGAPKKMDAAFIRDNFFSLSALDEVDDEDDDSEDLDDLSEFTRQFVG